MYLRVIIKFNLSDIFHLPLTQETLVLNFDFFLYIVFSWVQSKYGFTASGCGMRATAFVLGLAIVRTLAWIAPDGLVRYRRKPKAWQWGTTVLLPTTTQAAAAAQVAVAVQHTSLREVYRTAKEDPRLLTSARELADSLLFQRKVTTVKDAMRCVSIYKLCSAGGLNLHLDSAIGVLDYVESEVGLTADTYLYNNVLDMCAKGAAASRGTNVRIAHDLLERMCVLNIERDVGTYTGAIQTAAHCGKWREAIELLQRMAKDGVNPDTIAFSSVIQGCTIAGRWKEALTILMMMHSFRLKTDTVLCNCVISACAGSGEWAMAQKVMDIMHAEDIALDSYTYTSAISACDHANGFESSEILYLIDEMIATTLSKDLRAAPFNAAICSLLRHDKVGEGLGVYNRMLGLGVACSEITVTTLVTGLARLGEWQSLLDVFVTFPSDKQGLLNEAVLGSALKATEKIGNSKMAKSIFAQLKRFLGEPVPTQYYNSLINSFARDAGAFNETSRIKLEMLDAGVSLNAETYTALISTLKQEGLLDASLALLEEYESSKVFDSCNAYPYTASISVCVEAKDWERAIDILERLERLNAQTPSRATYNSAIEALDAAGEAVRAELVYQSALRSGVYQHWVRNSTLAVDLHAEKKVEGPNVSILDLHFMPTSVGRSAIMHALGEIFSEVQAADPLFIITGRGNRAKVKGKSGVLAGDISQFLEDLGIEVSPQQNPGRIKISKASIEKWFRAQEDDDTTKRQTGKVHGNLFVAVAKTIKQGRRADIKRVCPFSDATKTTPVTSPQVAVLPVEVKAVGGCPAHSLPVEVKAVGGCPAHSLPVEVKAVGGCPAHGV